ncbi:hypothetical protein KY338_05950 [Candidatus Woesearchaeota archaeon]|nr:hypothetical protein [Candidatus Woesearchaeota archaeon]MBW3006298.1 hypothetical protein [Candidatus Woesearchaeota archaeon]
MSEEKEPKKQESIIDAFELSDLLPSGVAFEIRRIELKNKGVLSEGDVSSIYAQMQQVLHAENKKTPEALTYHAVRKHYGL